ncbi:MAG: hypothetical protein QNK04_00185 [Myxococcota bacterium]|nr:hypothetical protein [Myxococcota bacterium]
MRWCRGAALVLTLLVLGAGATAARAQQFEIDVTVCKLGEGAGGIDPKCSKLHAKLQKELRYESLSVLKTGRLRIGLDEVGTLELPNGQAVLVRPLDLDDERLLLAAEAPGLKTDLKVEKGQTVVMGGARYQGGKIAASFEVRW